GSSGIAVRMSESAAARASSRDAPAATRRSTLTPSRNVDTGVIRRSIVCATSRATVRIEAVSAGVGGSTESAWASRSSGSTDGPPRRLGSPAYRQPWSDLLSIRTMRVLILYESRRGFTLTVARAIRDEVRRRGLLAETAPLRGVDRGTVAAADALIVGSWVKGAILFGVGPAEGVREAIEALPDLDSTVAAVFCTCDVAPRSTLQ